MEKKQRRIKLFGPQWEAFNCKKRFILCSAGVQGGKGLWEREPVLTPKGYVPIIDVEKGDVVFDRDGKKTKVVEKYIRGLQPCYRFTFDDGSTVVADSSHLWVVLDPHYRKERVVSTKDLVTTLDHYWTKDNKCSIPEVKPIDFDDKSVGISPYLMGVLLSEGCLRVGVGFSSSDSEVIDRVKKESRLEVVKRSEYDYALVERKRNKLGYPINSYMDYLKKMGLWGKLSHQKFIPDEYKFNSVSKRLDILRGMMDGDGYIKKNKEILYYSTSKKLADDVVFLVESLGGKANIKTKKTTGRDCYTVRINIPTMNPFYLRYRPKHIY